MKTKTYTVLLLLLASSLACGGKETPGAAGGKPAPPPRPTGPGLMEFRIGRGVAGGGKVTAETDSFRQGEPIIVSFEVANLPPNSSVKTVWADAAKKPIAEEEKVATTGNDKLSFEVKDSQALPEGNYVATFFYKDPAKPNWSGLGEKPFRVGPK
ncbi:MAG TPA: hypothetical protein VIY96_11225 [Thermoanaerobaculia bacterium]